MNKNKLFIVLIAVLSAGVLVACNNANPNADKKPWELINTQQVESQQTMEVKPMASELAKKYAKLLQGRWMSISNNKNIVEYKDDKRISMLEGKEVSNDNFKIAEKCGLTEPAVGYVYINQGENCWLIQNLDEQKLSLGFEGQSDSFDYVRVDENNKVVPEQKGTQEAEINLALVSTPSEGDKIASPVTVTGKAPANWFFEASFPVEIVDADGKQLGIGQASPNVEWTKPGVKEFKAVIEFTAPTTSTGKIILRADNPSGLPENDHSVEIAVKF